MIAALVTSAAMSGAWFLNDGPAEAYAGAVEALKPVVQAGRFVPLDGPEGAARDLAPDRPEDFSAAEAAAGTEAESAESFLVQIEATAPEAARLWLQAGAEPRSAAPLLVALPAARTVSALVKTDAEGRFQLVSDAAVSVSVQVTGAFTAPGEDGLGPGGTAATEPYLVLDAGGESGPAPTAANPALIAPAGLGGADVDRTAGGWLQITAEGDSGAILAGPRDALVEVAAISQAGASALIPTGLDPSGRVYVAASGQIDSLKVNLVGWTAGAAPDQDASVFEDGLVLGPLTEGAPPAAIPAGAVSVYSLALDGGPALGASGQVGGVDLAAPATTAAGQAVLASAGTAQGAAQGIWSGYFAGRADAGGDAPSVTIESPAPGSRIDLAAAGGEVTFSGTVESGGGLSAVVLKQGDRYIGAASLRPDGDRWSWSYHTAAPGGRRQVTVEAVTAGGVTGRAEAAYEFVEPAPDAVVVSPRTVVAGQDFADALSDAAEGLLVTDAGFDVAAGDILVVPPGDLLPEGALALVEGVVQAGSGLAISYRQANLTDAIRQIDQEIERLPVTVDPVQAVVEESQRPSEPERSLSLAAGASAGEASASAAVGEEADADYAAAQSSDATASAPGASAAAAPVDASAKDA
ncbi:MAG: hypothetical protein LBG60_07610, partial [Bifidobacteriaceae bacterium]|nr:hypothetical protein [Bifidobacteriaceae bacterium]